MQDKNTKQKKNNSNQTKKTSNTTSKSSATKKATTKASKSTKKTSVATKKASVKKENKPKTLKHKQSLEDVLEYYDLSYKYNKTFVKILSQTPNTLFVYWDISDEDKKNFVKTHGEKFFEQTKPVLIVYNKTKNYSFEIEVNDFANSWYFNVNDTKCEYEIELGRKSYTQEMPLPNNYMYIASSNKIETPNDHILFEKEQKTVFFKNVKTNNTYSKNLVNLQFINHIGNSYKVYDFYNKIYKPDELNYINNPTSNFMNN